MKPEPRQLQSDYMDFAKFKTTARYNLASSGVADCALDELGLSLDALALHGPNASGYDPLIAAIAARFDLPEDCVVSPGGGCSFANHLAFAALVSPGDRVLVEAPTYELLTATLAYHQARPVRFERRLAEGWRLDAQRAIDALTPDTRLVVLTNLHNPSSALADDAAVEAIAAAAARIGAMVLIDEVYRELTFGDGPPRTAFQPEGDIVVTSSLTKAYGLSGLRCGWILAPAPLAHRLKRLNDLFGVAPPHIAELMALQALTRLPQLRARAEARLAPNRAAYREILGGHPGLEQVIFDQGTTVFPRLVRGDGQALYEQLRRDFDTSIVPGRFFGLDDYIRVGLGGEAEPTREGLIRLAQALDQPG